jgi:hypothetical protein
MGASLVSAWTQGVGHLLGPGGEVVVQLLEALDAGGFCLGEEPLSDVAVEPFLLSPTSRLIGLAVHKVGAEHRAGPCQLRGTIRRSVVGVVPTSAQF